MYRKIPRVSRVIVTTACLCYFRLSLWNISLVVADISKPISCSFESEDNPLCQWQQASNDIFDWTLHSGLTQSANTGPQFGDQTTQSSSGHYLYTEVSSRDDGANARIISPLIDPFDNSCAMTFYYNMYGTGIGTLRVYKVPWEDGIYGGESKVFEKSGNQGTAWHKETVIFGITYKFQVIIEGVRNTSSFGDIAIDDTSFSNSCEKFYHGSLRIVPQSGTDTNQGRLDIYLNGVWGSICNRNFNTATDGVVACIQLGYRKASSSIYTVSASTPPILDNVQCYGNETGLLDCGNDDIGIIDASCNANRVVNIWCSDIIDICEDVGPDAFHCDNVHCVPSSEKCDFSNNCGDNSDEASSICDVYPGRANFQFDFGEWSQPETNGVDWSRSRGLEGSGGPPKDHKNKIDDYYLVVAGSNVGKKAQLCLDMPFEANPTNCSIRFYYYRNYKDTGTIDMIQRTSSPTEVWSVASEYQSSSQWKYEELVITSSESFHICFEATISSLGYGYLGLDDISLTPGCVIGAGECELTGPTFICDDGLCIHEEYLCDHVHHCLDASDENSTVCEDRVGYCTFQDSFCDWQQVSSDNLNWIRLNGDTPTSNPGPSVDHTFENHFGYYAYLEVSSQVTGHYADLVSPWLTINDTCKLRVFYHIYGSDVGSLKIGTMTRSSGFLSLFTETRSRDEWKGSTVNAGLSVHIGTEFQFVIRATVGTGNEGDIAIDDLSLSEGCLQVPDTTTISLPVSTHESLSDVSTTVQLLISTPKSRSTAISSKSTSTVENLSVTTKSMSPLPPDTTTISLPVSTDEPLSDVSTTVPLLISTPKSSSTTISSKSTSTVEHLSVATKSTTTISLPVSTDEPLSDVSTTVPLLISTPKSRSTTISSKSTSTDEHLSVATKNTPLPPVSSPNSLSPHSTLLSSSTQDHPVTRMTSETCNLKVQQTSTSCDNGYAETCSDNKMMISVKDWVKKECTWEIKADKQHGISLKVKAGPLGVITFTGTTHR
ncbi:MAM and LDL-receptor class A domain-containing protein 1-like isoform X2 [Anneissia japonica]|uniref:MAM and LDL-receptor class A domain-containing protein 1-like isoform X2 n=1 Tax=Anneissia japonica TaxID=1529436 RepID=UPI001425ADE4|nr:MAM and LDL-receptor class A domain-containing protein 1-like isoform X2 [Anneissia japonica]